MPEIAPLAAQLAESPLAPFLLGLAVGAAGSALAAWLLLRYERRSGREKLALLQRADAQLRDAFQSIAHDALHQSNESFLQLAEASLESFHQRARHDLESRQRSIDDTVRPLRESVSRVDATLAEVEKERVGHYGRLAEQLRAVAESHRQLHSETRTLAEALRAPNVRGRWGELQLRRVVELAGMLDHCDFEEQPTLRRGERQLRPDVVVHLPGGRDVIVDAKAPLEAYLAAHEASTPEEREAKLREHGRRVRAHLQQLGGRGYWSQLEGSPEFVVMFLPGLLETGVEHKVIPAGPTTLIALLRAVAYGWRNEQLARNAREISELGRTLHDRIASLAGHFEQLRRGLDAAVRSYDRAAGALERRLLAPARRLGALGVNVEESLAEPGRVESPTRHLGAPTDVKGESEP